MEQESRDYWGWAGKNIDIRAGLRTKKRAHMLPGNSWNPESGENRELGKASGGKNLAGLEGHGLQIRRGDCVCLACAWVCTHTCTHVCLDNEHSGTLLTNLLRADGLISEAGE